MKNTSKDKNILTTNIDISKKTDINKKIWIIKKKKEKHGDLI